LTQLGESGLVRRLAAAVAGSLGPVCRTRGVRRPVAVVGHRGAPRERAENTLDSFSRALALGANAIETDVCATSDGHFVLWHDADPDDPIALVRETGGEGYAYRPSVPDLGSRWRRPVRQLALSDLASRYRYVPVRGDGPAVPFETLDGLFAWAGNQNGLERILLDVKLREDETASARELLRTVREAAVSPPLRRVVFHLLSPVAEIVEALCSHAGEMPADVRVSADFELPGVLRAKLPHNLRDVSMGCGRRLWPGFRLEVCRVTRARNRGRFERVTTWTINRPRRLRRLVRIGVDAILTDDVPMLARLARAASTG
jgi:glycerophosphoryl diester phosphodiesterase